MVAERTELVSLQKPPPGYVWTADAREHPRATVGVYKSLAQGGAVPWQASPDGARRDAEPTDNLPTLTPGVNILPSRCSGCGSALLDQQEPMGGEQRGTLSCVQCGRQIAWLAPRMPAIDQKSISLVTSERAFVRGVDAPRTLRTVVAVAVERLDGCGPGCGIFTGHDPVPHEEYGRKMAFAELLDNPTGIVRTGPLTVDFDETSAVVDGRPLTLTVFEWGILAYVAARLGKLCPYYALVESVWDTATAEVWSTPGQPHGAYHSVTTHLCRLRKKLGPAAPLLERVISRGLRLRADPPIGGAEP